ncbi:uncharacterized protein LOC143177273 [Calliopsis andreniformis]|uniref:uncharacterized protein LOC143177273 n=1 Tax=Calliopsis andreniformis TaxID=337506 RepID=UPI003FCD9C8A
MYNGASSVEESDEVEAVERNWVEMEMEEHYVPQMREQWNYVDERHLYRDLVRTGCDSKYDPQRHKLEQIDAERRQRKRSKSRQPHYPPCYCISETTRHWPGKTKYPGNMEAVLDHYQNLLDRPINQSSSCMCGHVSQNAYHHSRSKQTNNYRYPRKHTYELNASAMMENPTTSRTNDSVEYYRQMHNSVKGGHKKDVSYKETQALTKMYGNLEVDNELPMKYIQSKKESKVSPEPKVWKQHAEKISKPNIGGKSESKNNEDEYCLCMRKLKFNLSQCDNPDNATLENVEEDRDEQMKVKFDNLTAGLSSATRSAIGMSFAGQPSVKPKNNDVLLKDKALVMDDSDCSKGENVRKQPESTRICKSYQRTTSERNSARKPDEDSMINREENQEDVCEEIIVKDDEQEDAIRKNIYAAGDLDLHATKSHILGLIDRALSNEFGSSLDPQKPTDMNRGLTQQENWLEITRDLLADCCQPEDVLTMRHHGLRAECIKELKILRWKHMNSIQDEFKKLCNLQKFLDSFSPRQSMPSLQTQVAAVEQRPEKRQQQQQEEKQNLGTIS